MSDARIHAADRRDMEHVARRLRPEHRREALLLGLDGAEALRQSFAYAAVCYALTVDGEPLFLAGAMEPPALGDASFAWLAGTEAMDRHPFLVLEAARRILPFLHGCGAARIENHVPRDYRKAIKFAKWLGCREGGESVRGGVRHVHLYHDWPGGDSL